MTLYLWDISNHDWDRARAAGRSVDLADARKAGISGVTHKVTEGCAAAGAYVDPYFDDFARQLSALKNPFPVAGSYHATHRDHAVSQADFWFDTVTVKYPAWQTHPCWLWQIDAEPLDGYPAPTKADIVALGERLEARGVARSQIVLYGPRWVYANGLDGVPYRLWASAYGSNPVASFKRAYPGDRSSAWDAYSGYAPLIVQFGSRTRIGAQRTCDANAVRVKSEAALQALFLGSPVSFALLEEIMALTGAPKDYKTFLDDVAEAVLGRDVIPVPVGVDAQKNPSWTLGTYVRLLYGQAAAASAQAGAAADRAAAVATVVNALAPRVAALQATVAKLGPAPQAAIDAAALAVSVADAVAGKVKGFVWGVK